jgi:hypothetical protein
MKRARGTFVVRVEPQPMHDNAEGSLGRMSIDKSFHGDLEAWSVGEMLTASTPVKGSAAYVALERVSGALHGRTGTFMLQHTGTMTRGAASLTISVVPDSGTGQLTHLVGTFRIEVSGGTHSYELDYMFQEPADSLSV